MEDPTTNPRDHWRLLHEAYLGDALVLLRGGRDPAAVLLLTTLVVAAAGFFTGRDQEEGVEKSWQAFAAQSLPEFTRVSFGDLVFSYAENKDIPVRDTAHLLYCSFRNGLVHEGGLPTGFRVIRDESGLQYRVSAADGSMEVNILALYQIVEAACNRYSHWLQEHPDGHRLYAQRLCYLGRRRFRKSRSLLERPK
jgi:hypothetical protein